MGWGDVDKRRLNIRGELPFAAGRGTAWRENKKKRGVWDERGC